MLFRHKRPVISLHDHKSIISHPQALFSLSTITNKHGGNTKPKPFLAQSLGPCPPLGLTIGPLLALKLNHVRIANNKKANTSNNNDDQVKPQYFDRETKEDATPMTRAGGGGGCRKNRFNRI